MLETVALDVMSPYPLTRVGNPYTVMVVDMMPRRVEVKAVQMAETNTIICYLEEDVFICWRYPEALLMDNGNPLMGHKWKHVTGQK